jgi:hypothetical protein
MCNLPQRQNFQKQRPQHMQIQLELDKSNHGPLNNSNKQAKQDSGSASGNSKLQNKTNHELLAIGTTDEKRPTKDS